MNRIACCFILFLSYNAVAFAGYPADQRHYWKTVRPIMDKYCSKACHNADDAKAGLNLNKYDFIARIQQDGDVFGKVIGEVQMGTMPPVEQPQITQSEKDTLLYYLNKYLDDALAAPDPGIIQSRRLSNREYKYAIEDLLGEQLDTDSIFPRDPGGGEGFDNYAKTLYLTPLLMERYFDVADELLNKLYVDEKKWDNIVPRSKMGLGYGIKTAWYKLTDNRSKYVEHIQTKAKKAIMPFATLAYRRYVSLAEQDKMLNLFNGVVLAENFDFEKGVREVYKSILVSPHFLLRHEADPPKETPYQVSNFELATRLSFFLWSSIPDQELLQVAYRNDLHDPAVLQQQVDRMIKSPKIVRLAESFASQWLEVDVLNDPTFEIDKELFPSYSDALVKAMHGETVEYFHHAMTKEKNLLTLLDSDYTFVNEILAEHYNIPGIVGEGFKKVNLKSDLRRGGVLGMAGVLTATSLPNRTSPVLRGKWVMEKLLATKAKPPPPNVPDLSEAQRAHDEMDLRQQLTIHREDPACIGCHKDMDDLGFALENFDAIGRYRTSYKNSDGPIDVSGDLGTGEKFEGVTELKEILLCKSEDFAKGMSTKMLGFALGRSIVFKDKKVIQDITDALVDNDFNPEPFIYAIVNSYPFRYKKSDPVIIDTEFGT